MKYILGVLGLFLVAGCASSVKMASQMPTQVLNVRQAVRTQGVWEEQNLEFAALSVYEDGAARVVLSSPFGFKWADMRVTPDGADVFFKQDEFPFRALKAFVRFAQAHLLSACPQESRTYFDKRTHSTFTVQSKGGVCF